MSTSILYITTQDKAEALKIGRVLVEDRLVARVNIFDNMTSLYWWDGKVNEEGEVVMMAKTRQSLVEQVIEKVNSLHSYECPCVVSWQIEQGNPKYLEWLEKETG